MTPNVQVNNDQAVLAEATTDMLVTNGYPQPIITCYLLTIKEMPS